MKQLTINLFTWREAKEVELYCKSSFDDTKIVPVTVHEDGDWNVYYVVYVLNTNNRWTPAPNIEPEEVRE